MDATIVAMNAKNLRIFYENPFLVKFFAYGLRRPFGDSPRALPGGQRSTLHRGGRYHAVGEIAPDGRGHYGDRWGTGNRSIFEPLFQSHFPFDDPIPRSVR